jgi:hypothetical protein
VIRTDTALYRDGDDDAYPLVLAALALPPLDPMLADPRLAHLSYVIEV